MGTNWRTVAVGDAFDVNPYRAIKRGQVTPFIPMDALPEHTRTVSRVDEREFTGSGTKFQNGDTLIARITPCLENGKTAFVAGLPAGVVAHGSTEYIVLAGKPNQSDSLFAYYLARSPDFRRYAIGHMEGTSGRQRVPSVAVQNFLVSLPSLPEQRAIAHILGTLDDKIELNRRMNETLEAMARALFQSWFVDFDPIRAKMEGHWRKGESLPGLPAHLYDLFPDSFEESELGEIPRGWKVQGLDEIANFLNGLALQKYSPGDGATLPVIKIAQLRKGDTEGADRCNTSVPPKYVINDGDVLFSWSGSLECILWAGDRGALNQHLFKVTSTQFCKWFYYLWVHEHLASFRHTAAGKATTMGHIQRHHLSDAKVVVPESDVLDAVDKMIAPIIEQIMQRRIESRTLATLRDMLLPKLISGELRVAHPKTLAEARQ
ncbi:MAG: restriction endonuclease subunit S [Gammaproteobacteria bacterium]|nr:restriction endonuclease subunit S [Gammaproteobacteria bacterium]